MLSARRLSDFVRLQAAVSHGLTTGLATWPEVTTKSVDGISVEPVGFNSRFLPDFLGKKDHLSSLWLRFTVFFLTKSHHPIMGSTWYKVVRLSEVHHAMCFQWLTWTMRWIEMIYPWASSLPWLFAKPSVHIITDPKPIGCITPAWSSWLASECDYRPYTDLSQVPLHHQAMKFWSKLWYEKLQSTISCKRTPFGKQQTLKVYDDSRSDVTISLASPRYQVKHFQGVKWTQWTPFLTTQMHWKKKTQWPFLVETFWLATFYRTLII